jgi:RNA polymerase sigma-70 factor (ECF subfamily)
MSNTTEQNENSSAGQSDAELIKRFVSGDLSAFDELVRIHSSQAFQVAFGLLGDKLDAEGVVQDAFVKVFRNLDKFRGDSSFSTWLYRIVTKLSRNKYHWHRRRGADVNISLSAGSDNPDTRADMELPDRRLEPGRELENREMGMELVKAIQKLPEKLREVIILRHIEDMSYSEIADILKCELGTVKSRLARAREALKSAFPEEYTA